MEAFYQSFQRLRYIPRNALIRRLGPSPKQHHHSQGVGALRKEVYQVVLMHPIDLSQKAANPVALDGCLRAAGGASNLYRHVGPDKPARYDAVEHAYTAGGYRPYILAATVEQRTDQAPPFEPSDSGKRVPPGNQPRLGSVVLIRQGHTCPSYLPENLSLTDSFLRPF